MTSSRLGEGKLPIGHVRRILDSIPRGRLLSPRGIGMDVGITKLAGRYLVSSSDPITGAKRRIGWYAVNVSANDVATSGIMPETFDVVMLFPVGTGFDEIQSVTDDVNEGAAELGLTISKGHTEITGAVVRPMVTVTAFGSGERFVTAADAHPGDAILMTKTAGIEGTSILAGLKHVRSSLPLGICQSGERLIDQISVIPEASVAFQTGMVHSMHDVTEGGVLAGVLEMGMASKLGFEIHSESIPVEASTRAICRSVSVRPLRLIGSGALLIACSPSDSKGLQRVVRDHGIRCSLIGKFLAEERERRIVTEGRARYLGSSMREELWSALARYD